MFFIDVAICGQRLFFHQLRAQGGVEFPEAGAILVGFNRPALVPKVKLHPDFIIAARGKDYSINETEEDGEGTGFVNTVWNNIENYLPNSVIDNFAERESLRSEI